MEEAGAFFAGSKDEYEVAKVIQSRVQLYFDEYESVYNNGLNALYFKKDN